MEWIGLPEVLEESKHLLMSMHDVLETAQARVLRGRSNDAEIRGMLAAGKLITALADQLRHLDDMMHRRAEPYRALAGVGSEKKASTKRPAVTD